MMGHGHGSFNLAVGLSVGDAMSLPPLTTLTLGLASAGAGLLPDIDCKGSTAATVFGPISEAVHYGSVQLHNMVSASLTTDKHEHGAHRGLTHWWPFWIVCGVAVWVGCMASHWAVMGVLAVLFALAARGLTIPDLPAETQGRFDDSARHKMMMKLAYRLLNLCPFTWLMRRGRKHVAKTRRYGWERLGIRIGVGKIITAGVALTLAWYLTMSGAAAQLAPWLGLVVGVGMAAHWFGDCPTHMGVPGIGLHQVWKLPFWASFYAGGPFEIMVIWFGLGWLNLAMLPGLLKHAYQMTILFWAGLGLGSVVVLAIIVEGTSQVHRRRYAHG